MQRQRLSRQRARPVPRRRGEASAAPPPPNGARTAPPHEPVGLLVAAARRAIKLAVGRRVGEFRLTPQQFWLLVAIQEGRTRSLGELAERLGGDQPTASRIVAALARRDLVRVDEDPHDRRRARLSSGPAGEALRRRLAALVAEIRAAIVDGMDEREQEALRAGLRRIIGNMGRFDAERALGPQPSGSSRRAKIPPRDIATRALGPQPSGSSRLARTPQRDVAQRPARPRRTGRA